MNEYSGMSKVAADFLSENNKYMTERDWLAGMAMQGMLSANTNGHIMYAIGDIPKLAYELADSMIKKCEV